MSAPDKLYIAVRADLPAGLVLSQAVHAAIEFALERPAEARAWRERSNTVAVVAADDERALRELQRSAGHVMVAALPFNDPDLSPTLTAVALEPGQSAKRLCKRMPLALAKESAKTGPVA